MSSNVSATVIPAPDIHARIGSLFEQATLWLQSNWFAIAVAMAAAVVIYILLNLLRQWGLKLCRHGDGVATWYSIVGRALARTGHLFMIVAAVRLVIGYVSAPPSVHGTVTTVFTVVAVIQVAIWARELIFGAVEHRTRDQIHNGQAFRAPWG
jgi:hypothetical protein